MAPRGATKKALGLEGVPGPDLDQVMRKAASLEATRGSSNVNVLNRSELQSTKSPMSARAAYLIGRIRTDMGSGEDADELLARASALVEPSFWSRDLTVVVESEIAARLGEHDAGTFESGAARANVLESAKRALCGADDDAG